MLLRKLIPALAILPNVATARDVFAHYMIQGLDGTTDHASQDVNTALDMGFTGFALNVGNATVDWSVNAIAQLFAAAADTDFKLFFSMDLAQDGNAYDFISLINEYASHSAYYRTGSNNNPLLSTFSASVTAPDYWPSFFSSLGTAVYFLPCFDNTEGYYDDINNWMTYWGGVVDGLFSWETAWPGRSDTAANVTTEADEYILAGAHNASKSYMIGLSSLQYKHWSGNHYYRVGEVNLPQRMEEILALEDQPDFVEVMTWNDAGEGHYIGHLWSEGLTDDILAYANNDDYPHTGWQPLVTSFITAYKYGTDASGMRPPAGTDMVGTMWYRAILADAACAADPMGRPLGAGAAKDAVNWAIVVGEGVTGMSAQVWSAGVLIGKTALVPGLNYGSTPGMSTGIQYVEVVDSSNNVVMSAQGAKEVEADSTDICNFNYQVAELAS